MRDAKGHRTVVNERGCLRPAREIVAGGSACGLDTVQRVAAASFDVYIALLQQRTPPVHCLEGGGVRGIHVACTFSIFSGNSVLGSRVVHVRLFHGLAC